MHSQDVATRPHQAVGVSAPQAEKSDQTPHESAQLSYFQLSATCYLVAGELAQRTAAAFPGLDKLFAEGALLVVGGQRTGALGAYEPRKWAYDARPLDEIHVNIGHVAFTESNLLTTAETILTSIGTGLLHLYAQARGINSTTGRGKRYHNKKFALLADRMELRVVRHPSSHIGFTTSGLTHRGREIYGDLIERIAHELRLLPNYKQSTPSGEVDVPSPEPGTETAVQKYIFAHCGCTKAGRRRTLRMARGWWIVDQIGCAVCKQIFTESPPKRTKSTR